MWRVSACFLVVALLGGVTLGPTGLPPVSAGAASIPFGVVLVGPRNDHGWSEAHYAGGQYAERKVNGARMIYVDNVNPAAKPGVTVPQVVDDLVSKGARLVITTSDDFKDGTLEAAKAHPSLPIINVSGDHAWKRGRDYKAPPNESNFMGRMEYMKMLGGCAAALTTRTGKIGFLGPLANDETRRLADSAFLGARYCWTSYRQRPPSTLTFKVTWIGFWFNIPGQTLDPTKVADDFFNTGHDVVISGIDTTEALVEANKQAKAGKRVWAVPYDYERACAEAPSVCLGVPYFNWGPAYVKAIRLVWARTYHQYWDWNGPNWNKINDPDTSAVGFENGPALSAAAAARLHTLARNMGLGAVVLWKGPLRLADGSAYLESRRVATDLQVWYMPQLLQGMTGPSK
ncbi:MAG TPA: BMP family ABC transporter substrate-binding protein [bacterium]|nr:BMP family ABC transporter substrate-binding protein [bacterium]